MAEVNCQPCLVVEVSSLYLKDIVAAAVSEGLSKATIYKIKHSELCAERWRLSSPTIYVLHPSATQAYLSSDMRFPHYQIYRERHKTGRDLTRLRSVVKLVRRQKGNSTRLVEIKSSDSRYRDGYIRVVNNPDLSNIDRSLIQKELENEKQDPVRNNICLDFGYAGQGNSRRDALNLGLTRSNLMTGTMTGWVVDVFCGVTRCIDLNFSVGKMVYNDKERNDVFAHVIHCDNRIEGLRLAKTNQAGALLDFHCDNGNCEEASYAYVSAFSWYAETREGLSRFVAVTYGKKTSSDHMADRRKHAPAINFLRNVYAVLPKLQKSQGSDIFPKGGKTRQAYPYAFLDKGIFYSLFATAITKVFTQYPALKHKLPMMAAFLVNVCMSECADHYWKISDELCMFPRLLTDKHIIDSDPIEFGFNFMAELFRRKTSLAAYPVTRRHQPAVNRRPSKDQIEESINAVTLLIKELRVVEPMVFCEANAIHYYGKACEYLVRSAYGAGHLTAMHLLGVAACLRLVPALFLSVAEVGVTTKPWLFLQWAFGYSNDTAYDDTNTLLRAVSVLLGMPVLHVEELICIATKGMAPTENEMAAKPCQVDYGKCRIRMRRNTQTGDVVYKTMGLYRLTRQNVVYRLTFDGVFMAAEEVMMDVLYDRVMFSLDPKFWTRDAARKGGRYHYLRKKNESAVSNIKQYFSETATDGDDYVPTPTKSRSGFRWDERDVGVYKLLGPSFENIALVYEGREPCNLNRIVWKALGGSKVYCNKKMLRLRTHQLQLVRPPCVHPNYAVISERALFYSCCLVAQAKEIDLKVSSGVYWPDPRSGLMPARVDEEGALVPSAWSRTVVFGDEEDVERMNMYQWPNMRIRQRKRRRVPIDHSERTETVYLWNSFRMVVSNESPYGTVAVFRDKKRCIDTALAEFVFAQRHLLDINNPQVRSLFFMTGSESRNNARTYQYSDVRMKHRRIAVDKAEEVRVFYDSNRFRSSTEKIPFMIAIKYPRGGCLYYFCDSGGRRLSAPLLRRPLSKATRLATVGDTMFEFHCIVSHRIQHFDDASGKKKGIYVTLQWVDKSISEERLDSVLETSPLEVLHYAETNDLLFEPGWYKVRCLSKTTSRTIESTGGDILDTVTLVQSKFK